MGIGFSCHARSSVWLRFRNGWQRQSSSWIKALVKMAGHRSNAETGLALGLKEADVSYMISAGTITYTQWRLLMYEAGLILCNKPQTI